MRKCVLWLSFISFTVFALSGCGGGGGGGSSAPAKATISGAVTFPDSSNVVSKRVASLVSDPSVSVEAYTLDGKLVKSVNPTYDDASAQRIYSYSLPDLNTSVDYVIKVTRGTQILKRLVEKKDVVAGNVPGCNIDVVSTTVVILASEKLGVSLGDTLPTGKTVDTVSTAINTEVKPSILEGTIASAVNGGLSNITSESQSFVNAYNIIVVSVMNTIDPATVMSTPTALTAPVPIITVSTGGTPTVTTVPITTTTISTISTAIMNYTPPAETAAVYNDLARKFLAVQDISNASLNYEKALTIDPNDKEANFGGAITSGMMLIEDPDVQSIVTKWGAVLPTVNQVMQGTSPIKIPFGNMTSIRLAKTTAKSTAKVTTTTSINNAITAFKALQSKLPQQKTGFKSVAKQLNLVAATAPTVGEMQTLIDNVIIPRIDKILARLAKVEGTSFTFTVTKAMQGNPVNGLDIILNDGEFYTLDAALNIFKIAFKFVTSYNFDLPSGYTYDTISQDPLALINNPSFFTLKSDGTTKMNAALTAAKAAAEKAQKAYDIVCIRTAGQGAFDLTGWTDLQKTDFTNAITQITSALQGQATPTINGKAVLIDATKFFTNPLTRSNLPTFNYDVPRDPSLSATYERPVAGEQTVNDWYWDGTTYIFGPIKKPIDSNLVPKNDQPDYTLNGMLPNNSSANNVAGFNGILPVLDGKLLTGESLTGYNGKFTTDGTSAYTLIDNGYTYDPVTGISTYNYSIKKVNLTTGAVTKVGDLSASTWICQLLFYNGQLTAITSTSQLVAYPITGTTTLTLGATPIFQYTLQGSGWLQDITVSGTDIYYVSAFWDNMTGIYGSEVRKVNNLTDTLLYSVPEEFYKIAVSSNGTLYGGENPGVVKRNADGTIAASYVDAADWSIMTGGYFYTIKDGKLIKSAGTPAGGVAKLANSLLGKFF